MSTLRKTLFAIIVTVFCFAIVTLPYTLSYTGDSQMPGITAKNPHLISLEDAAALTRNFREQAGPDAVTGGFFARDAVLELLGQEGAAGMRYYYGRDDEGVPHIVLVATDRDGNDMVSGIMLERSWMCPPICATENDLNSPDLSFRITQQF